MATTLHGQAESSCENCVGSVDRVLIPYLKEKLSMIRSDEATFVELKFRASHANGELVLLVSIRVSQKISRERPVESGLSFCCT